MPLGISLQAIALGKRPHIIVGTPGRVVDHLSNTKASAACCMSQDGTINGGLHMHQSCTGLQPEDAVISYIDCKLAFPMLETVS